MSAVNVVYDETNNKYIAQPKITNSGGATSFKTIVEHNIDGSCYTASREPTDYSPLSGTNFQNYMSIFNPVGSGKTCYIYNFYAFKKTSSANVELHMYKTTDTPSGGTLLTKTNLNFSSSNTSVLEIRKEPNNNAYPANRLYMIDLFSSIQSTHLDLLEDRIILAQGTGIFIRGRFSTSTENSINIKWYEEDI
jgi:hypothetical protein